MVTYDCEYLIDVFPMGYHEPRFMGQFDFRGT